MSLILCSGLILLFLHNNNANSFGTRTNTNVNNVRLERGLILMSWDGVSRSVFLELYDKGYLPNIKKLNVYDMTDNTEFGAKAQTTPQHSIMLSGYLANVTNSTTNDSWQPWEACLYSLESKKLNQNIT